MAPENSFIHVEDFESPGKESLHWGRLTLAMGLQKIGIAESGCSGQFVFGQTKLFFTSILKKKKSHMSSIENRYFYANGQYSCSLKLHFDEINSGS